MKCKQCKGDHSWHDWKQEPYCSPYCKLEAEYVPPKGEKERIMPSDPERIIKEYGGEELSKTIEGVKVIQRAAGKYKKELLQRDHPDFKREYKKEIKAEKKEIKVVSKARRQVKAGKSEAVSAKSL